MGEVGCVLALLAARLGTPLWAWPRAGRIERRDRGWLMFRCRRGRRCGLVRWRPMVIARALGLRALGLRAFGAWPFAARTSAAAFTPTAMTARPVSVSLAR